MSKLGAMRFVVYGAAGFGIGWVVAGLCNVALVGITAPTLEPGLEPLPWWVAWLAYFAYVCAGAFGGAALGLAMGSRERTIALAIAGGVGLGFSLFLFFVVAFLFGLGATGVALGVGLFGGVTLGLTFGDWKMVVLLGWAGMVGFGVGGGDRSNLTDASCSLPLLRRVRRALGSPPVVTATFADASHDRPHRRSIVGSGPRIPREPKPDLATKAASWISPQEIPDSTRLRSGHPRGDN